MYYTRSICSLLSNAIDTQSGCDADHCRLFTSPSALYAKIGSSIGRLAIAVKSHIKACLSSPAVHI